ncbi:MAG: putative metal-binding motif-containing protein, partial [Myxococcales bacterium]|nr:putative metal-binding motif-containing protein [Myxococcales bacterium]
MRHAQVACISSLLFMLLHAGCSSDAPTTNGGALDAGADSAAGSAGVGAGGSSGAGGSAGVAGSGECQTSVDCEARLPQTTPAGCAEAECDPLAQKCIFRAKDADGDGHGAAKCSAVGGGTIKTGDDCDDADPDSYPGAWDGPGDGVNQPDRCDAVDQDCDGNADDDPVGGRSCTCDPANPPACSETSDGQAIAGLNSTTAGVAKCKFGVRECNDGKLGRCLGAVGPEVEKCDKLDNDCDGETDEDADGAVTWFTDGDGDGFGDPTTGTTACSKPGVEWYSSLPNTDCNDQDPAAHPGAAETCGDGKDLNCDSGHEDSDGFNLGPCEVGQGACLRRGETECTTTQSSDCSVAPGAPPVPETPFGSKVPYQGAEYTGWDWNCNGSVDLWGTLVTSCASIPSSGCPGNSDQYPPPPYWVLAAG